MHFLLLIANVVSSGMAEGEGGEGGAERLVSPPPHHHPADTPAMLPTWSRRLTHTNRYLFNTMLLLANFHPTPIKVLFSCLRCYVQREMNTCK